MIALYIIMLLVASCFTVYERSLPKIRLSRVSSEDARRILTDYLDGMEESTFGFPSGMFYARQDTGSDIVLDEVTHGSAGFDLMKRWSGALAAMTAFAWARTDKDDDGGLRVLAPAVTFTLAIVTLPYMLIATVSELLLQRLLRSRITARVAPDPDDARNTLVEFTLKGPCAILAGKRLNASLGVPELPERFRPPAEVAAAAAA